MFLLSTGLRQLRTNTVLGIKLSRAADAVILQLVGANLRCCGRSRTAPSRKRRAENLKGEYEPSRELCLTSATFRIFSRRLRSHAGL